MPSPSSRLAFLIFSYSSTLFISFSLGCGYRQPRNVGIFRCWGWGHFRSSKWLQVGPYQTVKPSLERGHRTLTILRKGGKVVTVPLAPRTARAVDLAIGERLSGPIFISTSGERMDRHGAGRIVRRVARRAGIDKPIGPHTLRHAFITALDAGVPLRDVQEAASHSDPRTTMRYDRARVSLDRHATYIVATYIAGASR